MLYQINHSKTSNIMQIIPVNSKSVAENYPYGRLTCKMTFAVEFKANKGFRHTRQSVNPKTGRTNALKTETYADFSFLQIDPENGHTIEASFNFHSAKQATNFINFLGENAKHLKLTAEQSKFLCNRLAATYKLDAILDKELSIEIANTYLKMSDDLITGKINFNV